MNQAGARLGRMATIAPFANRLLRYIMDLDTRRRNK